MTDDTAAAILAVTIGAGLLLLAALCWITPEPRDVSGVPRAMMVGR